MRGKSLSQPSEIAKQLIPHRAVQLGAQRVGDGDARRTVLIEDHTDEEAVVTQPPLADLVENDATSRGLGHA